MIYKIKQLALSLLMLSILSLTLSSANALSATSCEHSGTHAQSSLQSSHQNNLEDNHCENEKPICDCDNCNCMPHLASSVYIDLLAQNNEYNRHLFDIKIQINHLYSQPFNNPLLRPPII